MAWPARLARSPCSTHSWSESRPDRLSIPVFGRTNFEIARKILKPTRRHRPVTEQDRDSGKREGFEDGGPLVALIRGLGSDCAWDMKNAHPGEQHQSDAEAGDPGGPRNDEAGAAGDERDARKVRSRPVRLGSMLGSAWSRRRETESAERRRRLKTLREQDVPRLPTAPLVHDCPGVPKRQWPARRRSGRSPCRVASTHCRNSGRPMRLVGYESRPRRRRAPRSKTRPAACNDQ